MVRKRRDRQRDRVRVRKEGGNQNRGRDANRRVKDIKKGGRKMMTGRTARKKTKGNWKTRIGRKRACQMVHIVRLMTIIISLLFMLNSLLRVRLYFPNS